MSNETVQRFQEIIQWWGYHKKDTMPLEKKVELQEKMIDNMFTLMTMMYRDQRLAEVARRRPGSAIQLPHNMGLRHGGRLKIN